MAAMNCEKLVNEIDGMLSDAAESSSAEAALPFEAFEDYSTDPVSFNDQSKLMLDKVDALFNLAVKYNRRSSQYLKACGHLEQGIKYLASGCVTKIALERNNHKLPDLGQLTTDKLFRMASYHYRKIDRALSEYIQEKQGEVDEALLDMEFRYYNLLNRLRMTEVRIHNLDINWCFDDKKNYDPLIGGLAFSKDSWTRSVNRNLEPASFQSARSFSPLKTNEEGKRKNEELKASACEQQAADAGNEEGRMKNEELDSSACEQETSEPSVPSVSESGHMPMITEPPAFFETLVRAMERGQEAGEPDGTVIFTDEEMRELLKDPLFCMMEPDMTKRLREIVNSS